MTKQTTIYDMLEIEDLTPDFQMLAEICGIEATKKIIENFSGVSFYIPKITCFAKLIEKYIAKRKSQPIKQIAKELGVSEQHIRNIRKKVMSDEL